MLTWLYPLLFKKKHLIWFDLIWFLKSMFIEYYFAVWGGKQQSWARIDSSLGEGDCISMPNQCSGSLKSKRAVVRYRKKEWVMTSSRRLKLCCPVFQYPSIKKLLIFILSTDLDKVVKSILKSLDNSYSSCLWICKW